MTTTTIDKLLLSGVTDGIPLLIAGTDTATADTIHTAHATALDEIWLHASNTSAADVELTLELGDTTAALNIKQTIPAKDGLFLVLSGAVLTDSKVLKAFAGTTNVINVVGYVNRITTV